MRYLLGLAVWLAGCGAGWAPFDRSTLPSDRWTDADRVTLAHDVTVRYRIADGAPVADVTTHRRIWYRTARSLENARFGVGHQAGLRELIEFRGRVLRPGGEETTFDRSDGIDVPAFSRGTIFSDARHLSIAPELEPGAVVEIRSTIRYRDVRLWSPGQSFAGPDPAERRRLVVELPPGWAARHLALEGGAALDWPPTRSAAADGGERLRWERTRIPPLPRERHAPAGHLMAARVSVQLARWTMDGQTVDGPAAPPEISAHLHRLQAPRLIPDDAIRERVAALLADVGPDPAARAARLHAHVRDRVRYVSVQLGMGGWIPHRAADVLDLGHGDCKDQASLLGAMLTVAGIPSRQIAVWAHSGWPRAYGLPTIAGNANHQVVLVDLPSGAVVVDPTHAQAAFGDIHSGLQGADALPLTADGDPVERLPIPSAETSRLEVETSLALDARGRGKGHVNVTAIGPSAYPVRHLLRTERGKERHRDLAERISLKSVRIDDFESVEGLEPTVTAVPLTARAPLRRTKSRGAAHAAWTLAAADLIEPHLPRIAAGARVRPIVLGAPRRTRHRFTVTLPEARIPGTLPDPQRVDTPFASYSLTWNATAGGLTIERDLTWSAPWIAAEQADDLRAFTDAVARADARAVIVRPPPTGEEPR